MVRRKKSSGGRFGFALVVALVMVVVAGFGWWRWHDRIGANVANGVAPAIFSATRVDPANDGQRVRIEGNLVVTQPVRDPQLGISADAPVLFRIVEMYQWREHCDAKGCRYDKGWSPRMFDSSKFRVPAGHENPLAPFVSAHFVASEIRLGAFTVDPALAMAQLHAVDFPTRSALLPPNLAASFRDLDGALYAGSDPAHPTVGALRIHYRVLPVGAVGLAGVQHGAKLGAR